METNFQDQLVKVVVNSDNHVVASSLDVAKAFERNHKDVLRSIRGIIDTLQAIDIKEDLVGYKFAPSNYLDSQGKTQPAYEMSRDGFSLLAMGFEGEKALMFKVKFINAFNKMEAALTQRRLHFGLPEADLNDYLQYVADCQVISDNLPEAIELGEETENRLAKLKPIVIKNIIDEFREKHGIDLCRQFGWNYEKICKRAKIGYTEGELRARSRGHHPLAEFSLKFHGKLMP